jgi:hypothetical protein
MIWIAAFLDHNLKEKWRKPFPLPRGFALAEALYSSNHLVGFWYSAKGSATDNLRIIDLHVKDTTIRESSFTAPEKSDLSHFGICSYFAIAGLNTKNDQSLLIRYDLKSGAITSTSQDIGGSVVIESMNIDKESGVVSTILKTTGAARKRAYYLVKTDKQGQKISELKLGKFDDSNLVNTAFAYKIDPNTDLVIGSFGRSSRTRVVDGYESTGLLLNPYKKQCRSNNNIL